MTPVLNWIKANVVIVIFVALMLAAVITMPLLASSMNAKIAADVTSRLAKGGRLDAVKSITIEQPGGSKSIGPNKEAQELYAKYLEGKKADAFQLHETAVEFNSKGRKVLMPRLFPQPPTREREVLPEKFTNELSKAYDALLREVRAGTPPSLDELAAELAQAESVFRVNTLKKGETEQLSSEETAQLQAELTRVRMTRAAQAAQSIGVYVSRDVLQVPAWVQGKFPSPAMLFEWQWKYWVDQDVLLAINDANKQFPSVVGAPVKQVLYIRSRGVPSAAAGTSGGTGGGTGASLGSPGGPDMGGGPAGFPGRRPRPGGGGAGFGAAAGGGGDGAEGGEEPAEPPAEPVAPRSGGAVPGGAPARGAPAQAEEPAVAAPDVDKMAEAPLDFKVSFTGRTTNQLYDVRYVDIGLIVDTAAVPRVLEALGQRNFITVIDLTMARASAFDGVREGYFYGDAPVSELHLVLETVWLREWTAVFMPPDLRAILGVKSGPATAG